MGLVACQTAYQTGAEWVDQLVDYLRGNLSLMRETFRARMPQIRLIEPEGTYLPWVDFSRLGLAAPELERFITERAKLWLDGGHIFGAGGAGFQRFNIATPRAILQEALDRLENAVLPERDETERPNVALREKSGSQHTDEIFEREAADK